MDITWAQVVVWIILGALAGSLLGRIRGHKDGRSHFSDLLIGLVGALIGGLIFSLFKIDLGLGDIAVSVEDLIAALLGSVLFLIILGVMKRKKAPKA